MWQTVPGAGVLVVRNGKVLMVAHERYGITRWELPSGSMEAGESFEQTAERETLEETGVHASIGCLLCTVVMDVPAEEYRGINAYFRAEALDNTAPRVCVSEPISCAAYVDVSRLRAKSIHPVDRKILNLWRRRPDRAAYYIYIVL